MLAQSMEAGARQGGRARDDAFDRLMRAHWPALRARAAQLCGKHGDPDDLVQEAMERAFKKRAQIRDHERAKGWLIRIVTNTFLDSLRKSRVRPGEVPIDVELAAPANDVPDVWERISEDDLVTAIGELPDDVRDTFRRFALQGQDYVQIAAELQIPKSTVGTRILRARKRLRELLLARLGALHA